MSYSVLLLYHFYIRNELKRDVDIIGRYGGEEFLAILPNTPLIGAITFSQKVRKKVETFNFLYKEQKVAVTISVGVGHCSEKEEQTKLISLADTRLYDAKQAGRNRVFPEVI